MWELRGSSTFCPRANERFVLHPVGEDGDKEILGTETRLGRALNAK